MSSQNKLNLYWQKTRKIIRDFTKTTGLLLKNNLIGLVVITGTTLIFFGPLLPNISTYSEGGDAMFNAWTLARNHHCILLQDCPNYSDGNIYFPNKDSMLYSETQLSAGILTLPLHFINDNPIFAYNVWTIASMLFSGFFMYLLAKKLSNDNEIVSVLAGLIFQFAPIKMTGLGHLQNLSIFYLPLIILYCLKIIQSKKSKKSHMIVLFISMVLLFYASWYQMVFGLMAIGGLIIGLLLFRLVDIRKVAIMCIITILAIVATLPLAGEYVRFSKSNQASFSIVDQTSFSSSVSDYFIPYSGTLEGQVYSKISPNSKVNSYNPDSSSFHGYSLYIASFLIILFSITRVGKKIFTKKERRLLYIFCIIGFIGLIVSLGPLLKVSDHYAYTVPGITEKVVIPLPYIVVDQFLPQLSFIRAVGRASILLLFALCCIIAIGSKSLEPLSKRRKTIILTLFISLLLFELSPKGLYSISQSNYSHTFNTPEVYKYINKHQEIDNLVILRSNADYSGALIPVVRAEDTLWAGYHNRNIFNGYSGYEPKEYQATYSDFVDFHSDDIAKMKELGLKYIVLDKQLSQDSGLINQLQTTGLNKVYEDNRYTLFKL